MLYLLPDELLVAIAEHCDQTTRKSLSLVSRRLRDPSQRIMFKVVHKYFAPNSSAKYRERLSEAISNERLLSYIQTITTCPPITSYVPKVTPLELLFTALHRMQSLRSITLLTIRFKTTMLDQLCKVLSTRFLDVKLSSCSYPTNYMIQQTVLKVQKLHWVDNDTNKPLAAFLGKSLSSITSLTLMTDFDGLADFGTMPRLRSFILLKGVSNGENVREFLVANPQLVDLGLRGPVHDLSLFPSSALPNLRRIRATADLMHDIVPGRPVADVGFYNPLRFLKIMLGGVLGGVRALSRSTAPIVELTIDLDHCPSCENEILGAVFETMPHLERIWLTFHVEVRSILYYDAI